MQSIVLDTSVIIKWFSSENENLVSEAKRIFLDSLQGKVAIYCPELMLYEVMNVLLKSKKLSIIEIENTIKNIYNLPINIVSLSERLIQKMLEIAEKHKLTSYDAAYVALAIHQKAVLYTCDKDLLATGEEYILGLRQYPKS